MTLSSSPPAAGDADADADADGDIDSATLGAAERGAAAVGAAALGLAPPDEQAANSTAVTPSIERRPRMDIGSSFATGLLGWIRGRSAALCPQWRIGAPQRTPRRSPAVASRYWIGTHVRSPRSRPSPSRAASSGSASFKRPRPAA